MVPEAAAGAREGFEQFRIGDVRSLHASLLELPVRRIRHPTGELVGLLELLVEAQLVPVGRPCQLLLGPGDLDRELAAERNQQCLRYSLIRHRIDRLAVGARVGEVLLDELQLGLGKDFGLLGVPDHEELVPPPR